jgi:alpha-beta hydrolase superfamily lysophospholipase
MSSTSAALVEEFTASDGYKWKLHRYVPESPRAEVVCLHGIQSHAGWYERSSMHLRDAGFAIHFLDRRGSGLNVQARGDAPSFRRLLDDVSEFLRDLRSKSPRPVVLLAISWGGKLAAALSRRAPGLVDALALLCPGICPRVALPFGERLRVAAARLLRPAQLFDIPLNDPALFTASPDWQRYIADDPLALRQATARFLFESFRLDLYLAFAPRHLRVPVLLQLAGRDQIIDNERTRRFVSRFASTDRTILDYPEAEHTLEFEPAAEQHVADLIAWLNRVTATKPLGSS